ncbi:MAG TPA: tRNA (adenosine(37)-N6)-threonylcarbamoyltransferase complex ATPase subunit type 1 TsaE [Steroidobacteraceae bacterium]|nr:tRNA (adenosine(37)-N6)-threonylcarbamoyltransferase complex ATPase subunit type 1 TsaE [Steroidobacteraceae bacterium]
MGPLTLQLPDARASAELGRALARAVSGAESCSRVVHLQGELGAGKSALARSFLQARGVAGPIRSPSYTLVETYPTAAATYFHVDLYRLAAGADLEELGLREQTGPGHVILIEWPERGGVSLPPADLSILLQYAGSGRHATLSSTGATGDRWLALLASDRRIVSYLSNLT